MRISVIDVFFSDHTVDNSGGRLVDGAGQFHLEPDLSAMAVGFGLDPHHLMGRWWIR